MRKFLLGVAVLLLLVGCEAAEKDLKHTKSSWFGLNRTVTLYDCGGNIIRQWTGRFKVEVNGGTIAFIDDGKEIKVSGTFTVEER